MSTRCRLERWLTTVDFTPSRSYEASRNYNEYRGYVLYGGLMSYKNSDKRHWELEVRKMDSADTAQVNSWCANNTTLFFYPDFKDNPSVFYTVQIQNKKEDPIKKMESPLFNVYYTGNIILEEM